MMISFSESQIGADSLIDWDWFWTGSRVISLICGKEIEQTDSARRTVYNFFISHPLCYPFDV